MIGEARGKWNMESCLWIVIGVLWIRLGSRRLQAQRAAGFKTAGPDNSTMSVWIVEFQVAHMDDGTILESSGPRLYAMICQ